VRIIIKKKHNFRVGGKLTVTHKKNKLNKKEEATPSKKRRSWVKPILIAKKKESWTEEESRAVAEIRNSRNHSSGNDKPDKTNESV